MDFRWLWAIAYILALVAFTIFEMGVLVVIIAGSGLALVAGKGLSYVQLLEKRAHAP